MRKFTQKEYEELCALLTNIHMNPEIVVHNSDINIVIDLDVFDKLYNLFNNNTFERIEFIMNVDPNLNDILFKTYTIIKNIKENFLNEDKIKNLVSNLKTYYNLIELAFKNIDKNSDNIKNNIIQLLQYLNLVDNSKITIKDLIEKIERYNIQADNDSKDLTIHKKEALADIERKRIDFNQSIDDYRKDIEATKEKLVKQYNDLNEYHKNFQNKIYKELDDIQNSVNREQLAAYFLNERRKLKGDVELPILIYTFLFEAIYFLQIDYYITASWHKFIFLRVFALAICIFILLLPCVQFLYYKIIIKNEIDRVKPFDEMKALLTPYWCWLGLTFSGMACIAKIAYSLYYINSTKFDHLEPYLLFANLPVFMILVWFTWFCSKQFSYTKQICDEYEYKYALSKSYLSYRDEAKNVSDNDRGKYDAIMVSLLDSVIKNIATSPVKSVKPDCHTPFTEVFGSLKDIIKTTDKKD